MMKLESSFLKYLLQYCMYMYGHTNKVFCCCCCFDSLTFFRLSKLFLQETVGCI